MKHEHQTCDCCHGSLPSRSVWEAYRSGDGDCTGSVDGAGRCRAYGDDAWDCQAIVDVLAPHGDRYTGSDAATIAALWQEHDMPPDQVDDWCQIGCWDPDTAAEWRDAGLTPAEVEKTAEELKEAYFSAAARERAFTDGCPIYATCNGDISPDVIIDAAPHPCRDCGTEIASDLKRCFECADARAAARDPFTYS